MLWHIWECVFTLIFHPPRLSSVLCPPPMWGTRYPSQSWRFWLRWPCLGHSNENAPELPGPGCTRCHWVTPQHTECNICYVHETHTHVQLLGHTLGKWCYFLVILIHTKRTMGNINTTDRLMKVMGNQLERIWIKFHDILFHSLYTRTEVGLHAHRM